MKTEIFNFENNWMVRIGMRQCHLWLEVKDVVGDGEVVFEAEWWEQDTVTHSEGESQLLFYKYHNHLRHHVKNRT